MFVEIPLFIGITCGVKLMYTFFPLLNLDIQLSISFICLCLAILYGLIELLISLNKFSLIFCFPAPDIPDFESIIILFGKI